MDEEVKLVRCPWCGEEISEDEYGDHLQDKHYNEDGVGPFPAGVPE